MVSDQPKQSRGTCLIGRQARQEIPGVCLCLTAGSDQAGDLRDLAKLRPIDDTNQGGGDPNVPLLLPVAMSRPRLGVLARQLRSGEIARDLIVDYWAIAFDGDDILPPRSSTFRQNGLDAYSASAVTGCPAIGAFWITSSPAASSCPLPILAD